jgi:hypothetical protein
MRRRRTWLIATSIFGLLAAALIFEVVTTRSVRGAVRVFSELLAVANRNDLPDRERIAIARSLCTRDYLRRHGLSLASEGGIVGIPRMMHKNFKAWREGPNIWLCPSNRVGPVYRFVYEDGAWRFDGLVGVLREWGEFVPAPALEGADAPGG